MNIKIPILVILTQFIYFFGVYASERTCSSSDSCTSSPMIFTPEERDFLKKYDGTWQSENQKMVDQLIARLPEQYRLMYYQERMFESYCLVGFYNNGKEIVLHTNQTVIFMNVYDCSQSRRFTFPTEPFKSISTVALCPEEHIGAVGYDTGNIIIFDADTGVRLRELSREYSQQLGKLQFSQNGKKLLVASNTCSSRVFVWNMDDDIIQCEVFVGMHDRPCALNFDGSLLALVPCKNASTIQLWDTKTATKKCEWEVPGVIESPLAFSPDGKMLAGQVYNARDEESILLLWNVADGSKQWAVRDSNVLFEKLTFSDDGTMLAVPVASKQDHKEIRFFDIQNGHEIGVTHRTDSDSYHGAFCEYLRFAPDRCAFALYTSRNCVELWKSCNVLHKLLVLKTLVDSELVSTCQRDGLQKIMVTMPADLREIVLRSIPLLDTKYDGSLYAKQLPTSAINFTTSDEKIYELTAIDQQRLLSATMAGLVDLNDCDLSNDKPIILQLFSSQSFDNLLRLVRDGRQPALDDERKEVAELLLFLQCENARYLPQQAYTGI